MLWITLAVIGAILIIASQIGSVRSWASRVFGRVMPGLPSLGSIGGALSGAAKLVGTNPLVALLTVIGLPALVFGVISYIEGRGADRERIKQAEASAIVAQHEAEIARKASVLAENTHRDRDRVRVIIARAEEEIEDAVEAADFDRLYDAYYLAGCSVFEHPGCSGGSDPNPPRAAPVRRPGASSA